VDEQEASDLKVRLVPSPDVVGRRVDDELVLVQLRSNQVYSVNRTGARLWELIAEGCSPADALERMLQEFDVPGPELRSEVAGFVELLVREDLVTSEEG
jgi:hypothetical protein